MVTPLRGWLIAFAMLGGGVVAGTVLALGILTQPFTFIENGSADVEQPPDSFSISGDLAEPYFPGGSAPLNVIISNPLDVDLKVSDLIVKVDAVTAPNATVLLACSVDDFAVEQLSGHDELVVEAGATDSLAELDVSSDDWPQVLMLNTASNQDGCKGASFSLTYSAVGGIVE